VLAVVFQKCTFLTEKGAKRLATGAELIGKISGGFDRFITIMAWIAGALIVFCMVSIVVDVMMRYIFGKPMIWVYYIAEYILLYSTFLAAPYVLRQNRHVRVDIVVRMLSERHRIYISIFTGILGLFYCAVLGYYTWIDTYEAFLMKSTFSTSLEMYQYPIKIVMPFGCLLLSIEFIRKIILSVLTATGKNISSE